MASVDTAESEILENLVSPEKLAELTDEEVEELLFFSEFLRTLMVIEGKKGSGKSQLAVALCSKLKKYFEVPIITDQRLRKAFGEYTYLDEKDFLREIEKVSVIAKSTPQEDIDLAVEWSLKKHNVKLEGAVIFFDEAYKYFECRSPGDKLVKVFGYFVAQMRHYNCTLILCTPSRRYLDRRVRDQIDFLTKVAYNPKTEFVHARFLNYMTGEVTGMRVYGPNYRHLYDSWGPIALRRKVLDIRRNL